MQLLVLYFCDPESRNWGFRIPALAYVGGGQPTREAAERAAIEGIAFALDPKTQLAGEDISGVTCRYYPVTVRDAVEVG